VACLPFNFAVVFDFNLFPVSPSKPKLIGVVQMNRQNAANYFPIRSRVTFLQKIFDEKIQTKKSCKKSFSNKVYGKRDN
jgi:hypothetical protein